MFRQVFCCSISPFNYIIIRPIRSSSLDDTCHCWRILYCLVTTQISDSNVLLSNKQICFYCLSNNFVQSENILVLTITCLQRFSATCRTGTYDVLASHCRAELGYNVRTHLQLIEHGSLHRMWGQTRSTAWSTIASQATCWTSQLARAGPDEKSTSYLFISIRLYGTNIQKDET